MLKRCYKSIKWNYELHRNNVLRAKFENVDINTFY